jgi:hypothetical protein
VDDAQFPVAIVFLEVRVIAGITGWEKLGTPAIETIVWTCVAFSVLVGDIAIQVQELWRKRPDPVRARAVSA